jgi:isocitrate dehydrogenase
MKMGYKNICLFDRHAVGGEYGAGYKMVGPGKLSLSFNDAATDS